MKMTTSILPLQLFSVLYAFMPWIFSSFGFTGMTVYPDSLMLFRTLYPYFVGLFDAPTIAYV